MWVPSKSALERESWGWTRGDGESGKFMKTKEKMRGWWRVLEVNRDGRNKRMERVGRGNTDQEPREYVGMWGGGENLGGWGRRRQAKTDHKKTQSKRQSWTNGFRAGCW